MSLKNPVTPQGIDPGTVWLIAQHLNHYATPGPSFSHTLQNYTAPCIMAMPSQALSCWNLAVEACIQSQCHPCGRWCKHGTWTCFFLYVFNSMATQLNARYGTHQTGIWRMHNRGHNRLSATPIIYCSENHTVWLVYLMPGTKGLIYTVCLLSFKTDCAQQILRAPPGSHPQKHVGASLDTLCG